MCPILIWCPPDILDLNFKHLRTSLGKRHSHYIFLESSTIGTSRDIIGLMGSSTSPKVQKGKPLVLVINTDWMLLDIYGCLISKEDFG